MRSDYFLFENGISLLLFTLVDRRINILISVITIVQISYIVNCGYVNQTEHKGFCHRINVKFYFKFNTDHGITEQRSSRQLTMDNNIP